MVVGSAKAGMVEGMAQGAVMVATAVGEGAVVGRAGMVAERAG